MARPKRAETDARSAPASTKKAKGGLAVGDQLPEFTLETDEGNQLSSAQLVREFLCANQTRGWPLVATTEL
jgi:hypothetical protein